MHYNGVQWYVCSSFLFFFKFVECLELKPVPVYNPTTNKTEPTFDIMAILSEQNKTLAFDR